MSEEYTSNSTFEDMKNAMEPYLPNWLPDKIQNKKKIFDRVCEVWSYTGTKEKPEPDVWDRQDAVRIAVKNIQVSHLLGSNEIIVPIIVEEYRILSKALTDLENVVVKRLKKAPELKELSSSLLCFKQKLIASMLVDDLKHLATMGIDVDIKKCMALYKDK